MRILKKGLALLLACMMLVMAVPFGGLSVLAEETDYPTIELGVVTDAVIDNPDWAVTKFYFTPEESGYYAYYSLAEEGDTYGNLSSPDNPDYAYDDDSGDNTNFRIVCYLEAGVTYTLSARYYSYETGTFPVCIDQHVGRILDRIEAGDVSLLPGSNGEWFVPLTVYYADGSSEEIRDTSWIADELGEYEICYDYEMPKTGESCTGTVSVNVGSRILSDTFTLTVEPSPVVSVSVSKRTMIKDYHGWINTEWIWDEETGTDIPYEYRYYDVYPYNMAITLSDGTVVNGDHFEWNGNWFYTNADLYQSYEHQLALGTHTVNASIAGYDFTYEVELVESPVASVVVHKPITRMEYDDGYWREGSYWDDDLQQNVSYKYFHYYDMGPRDVTITMKDGTVYDGPSFQWNGNWYGISSDAQSYDRQLSLGTNHWSGNALGCPFTYDINIIECPVASVTCDPVTLIENYRGY